MRMSVDPTERFNEIAEAISEKFGIDFNEDGTGEDEGEDWCYDTRWSGLTEDMVSLSKEHPEARIRMYIEADDGEDRWVEHFHGGRYYAEGQPEWDEPEWNDATLQEYPPKNAALSRFTVILQYPNYIPNEGGHPTWMGHVLAKNKAGAVLAARTEVMAGLDENIDPEDLYTIAVIAGHHKDLAATK